MSEFIAVVLSALCAGAPVADSGAKFPQEVVTIFTEDAGLPEGNVSNIDLDADGNPVIVLEGDTADSRSEPHPAEETLPKDAGQALSRSGDAVGTENGLYFWRDDAWQRALPSNDKYSWALRDVRVLAEDSRGRLWFGAKGSAGYLDDGKWTLFTGAEGLPYDKFTCATPGEDGVMWFGTEKGAIRADGENFAYRFSRRWLPDDYVNDIAVAEDGTAWIATRAGISRIERQSMTLEEKATLFTEQVESRHNRMGYIATCRLEEQYNPASWQPAITDNDGMYTAMYGAAQAFRYAVTGDAEAKALAVRSFEACKFLTDVTSIPGFPARVVIPVDWPEPVNEEYGAEYNERKRQGDPFWKLITPRFPLSEDGKYRWKCDTSSDELAGHFFFYGIYYDLVAETGEEKAPVREVVAAIADHFIREGYVLRDHDGEPTRWARFDPEALNSVHHWTERGLNSMMMLSMLKVAERITGEAKYAAAADELCEKHQYDINSIMPKSYFPPDNVVPWDNNLSLLSLYGLIKYEDDPERMLIYRRGIEDAWLHCSKQKNSLWNYIYGSAVQRFQDVVDTGVYASGQVYPEAGPYAEHAAQSLYNGDPRAVDAVESLRGTPLDLINYDMDNRHRLDIVLDPTPGQSPNMGWHYDGRALPIEERGHVRQDRDAFELNLLEGGKEGYAEQEGTFYLLPYYMGRYHGYIK
ncbi:MAG: hypothetical protein KJ052_02280 [Candidatus Hydrogenedentes bacterium]|nr:hypothetical protein [Candidatus Hydrogenedentota bacterium]